MSDASREMLVVILGHGSRRESGRTPVIETAERYQERHPEYVVRPAFMEFVQPDLTAAVEIALEEQPTFRQVIVVPLFLAAGNHVVRHMPETIAALRQAHPNIAFYLADPLGADPLLCDIVEKRVNDRLSM